MFYTRMYQVICSSVIFFNWMGLLPDTLNYGLRMRRECRERIPRHRLQRKPLVSDPGMHHGTCVTRVPWCMSGSLILGGGENVPGITGACATRNITYLVRGPWNQYSQCTLMTTGALYKNTVLKYITTDADIQRNYNFIHGPRRHFTTS